MVDVSTLGLFLVAVFALFISPGPNMAFVLSHGISHGSRGGIAAAVGITTADLIPTLLTATGFSAIIAAWPPSFDLLRYLGAMYLVWLAIKAIRSPGVAVISAPGQTSMIRIFRMAMVNSLLNPKALLFFMVFLPQFVDESAGQIALQLAILGATLSLAALIFNCVLGVFSGSVGEFLNRSPRAAKYQAWFLGAILLSLAVRLLFLEKPSK